MSELEWLACTDPNAMLNCLPHRATDRKLRLFAVACCRQVWPLLPDERSRAAVEVAERFADGLAGQRERASARTAALVATGSPVHPASWAAYWVASRKLSESIWNTCEAAVEGRAREAVRYALHSGADQAAAWDAAQDQSVREQVHLLLDVFGNPFRPAHVDPSWLRWRGGLLVSMAREIYDRGDFSDLVILADALEDAGCTNPDLLTHCRGGGEHVKGCWALDLLLERE